jgi:uncharacterized protein (DUF2132 family)
LLPEFILAKSAQSKDGSIELIDMPLNEQPRNPLHGLTLEAIVGELEAYFGWAELGQRIPVRCFTHDPSLKSSLKFLRKTPWARDKVEGLYLFMLREKTKKAAHLE